MDIMFVLLPMALLFGIGFLFAFIWAARKGQFDDLETPKHRILVEDEASEGAQK